MLTALGYTVDAVSSGEAAVAWLRERPADLVLLDMLMPPGMNGGETYREIVGFRPGQKALICSGYSQSADYEEARRLGAGRFLKKPFGLEQLAVAVRQELAGERPPETA
jgi:CheY-like chemotaxis protein